MTELSHAVLWGDLYAKIPSGEDDLLEKVTNLFKSIRSIFVNFHEADDIHHNLQKYFRPKWADAWACIYAVNLGFLSQKFMAFFKNILPQLTNLRKVSLEFDGGMSCIEEICALPLQSLTVRFTQDIMPLINYLNSNPPHRWPELSLEYIGRESGDTWLPIICAWPLPKLRLYGHVGTMTHLQLLDALPNVRARCLDLTELFHSAGCADAAEKLVPWNIPLTLSAPYRHISIGQYSGAELSLQIQLDRIQQRHNEKLYNIVRLLYLDIGTRRRLPPELYELIWTDFCI